MACAMGTNIKLETCAENSNQCLYGCKEKFQSIPGIKL